MGFNAPSKIQETALPTLLADPPQNMIAQSQFGTDLTIRYAVRGEVVDRGSKIAENIIIGTPGKVLDWSLKFKFFDLNKITVFVLDEADVMIATQGHQDQSIRIHKNLGSHCQMLLFSATYDQAVMNFAENIVTNPVTIKLRREEESLENIKQVYVDCPTPQAKYRSIANIYGVVTIGQAVIFCRTRKTVSELAKKMKADGHAVAELSADLKVNERIHVLDRFRDGKEKILITCNVCSRGIDIEQVTVVVNYDLPTDPQGKTADCESYLHRIGRTGRFGKSGLAINLVDGPKSMAILKQIENHFLKDIKKLNAEDVDEIEKLA